VRSDAGCIFGQFGAAINFTDGLYVYFLYPREPFDANLYQYTLMRHMRTFFERANCRWRSRARAAVHAGFPVWRLPVQAMRRPT
jgi:hypothetical protein